MIYAKKKDDLYVLAFKTYLAGEAFIKANNAIKSIPGRVFIPNGKESYWTIPAEQISYLKSIYKDVIDEEIKDVSFDHKEISINLDYIDEFKIQPYPFQILGMNFLASKNGALIGDEMGIGKAQPLYSKILTPNGWITFKDAKISQEIINSKGEVSKIIGIYPQGIKDVYKVTFNDGSSTNCCDDHLWLVNSASRNYLGKPARVKPLNQIKDNLFDNSGNSLHFIPMIKPVKFSKQSLEIDPYLLGLILGDGCISNHSCSITTTDSFIVEYLENSIKEHNCRLRKDDITYFISSNTNGNNYYIRALKELGLMGHTAHGKFIPEKYLYSDIDDRLALLQGLLDSDAHITPKQNIEYSTVSLILANNVIELVQSLGGKAKLKMKKTSWTHNGIKKYGIAYRMNIVIPSQLNPFRLPRKASLWTGRTKYPPTRAIKNVEYIGKEECLCISVDSEDHLYVTDDYILTHNTLQSLGAAYKLFRAGEIKNVLVICPASLKYQWGDEIEKFFDIDKFGISYQVVSGSIKKRQSQYKRIVDEGAIFTITNYETVRNDIDFYSSINWDILIKDEAHRLGNQVTQSFKAIAKIKAKRKWMATGTPLQNKPSELFHLFSLIDPDALGRWVSFRNKYIIIGEQYGRKNVPLGTKNLSELHGQISPYMLRRLKKDVAPQLPEMIITDRYVAMTSEQESLHNKVYEDLIDLIKEIGDSVIRNEDGVIVYQDPRADRILGLMTIMQEIADDPYLLELSDSKMVSIYSKMHKSNGSSPKTKELVEILKEYIDENNECKAVIFSRFTRMQNILYPVLSKLGKTNVANGSMNAEKKNASIKQFREDPNVRFLLSSDALNFGVNLSEAQLLINYDLDFNPAVIAQRNNRIHRINSTGSHVNIINLISRGAIDETILNSMTEKQELSNQVVENTDSERAHLAKLVNLIKKKLK